MSSNDPLTVHAFLHEKKEAFEGETTILPEEWVFDKTGNTRLKRKRKKTNNISQTDKYQEWLNFTCQIWGKKVNREKKARLMVRLKTNHKEVVEQEIINYTTLKK